MGKRKLAITRLAESEFEEIDARKEKRNGKQRNPEQWSIISALDYVLEESRDSALSDEFWKKCQTPLAYLESQLGLTRMQIVFIAIFVEMGEPMPWRKIGDFLGCSRLSVMVYSDELEELIRKGWVVKRYSGDYKRRYEGFTLFYGVVTALRRNIVFVPDKTENLTEQEFVEALEKHLSRNINDSEAYFCDDEQWMIDLVRANPNLPLCREILEMDDIHIQSLLLLVIFDYARYANSENEGLCITTVNSLYPPEYECDNLRAQLQDGSHPLIQDGYIEYRCEDGIADNEVYLLTSNTKERLLSNYTPRASATKKQPRRNRNVKSCSSIVEKHLYYNASEKEQIDRLAELLDESHLVSVRQRLEEQGMRKGIACLFYGAPGTGKTETALQLARLTGRDIMQVDISSMRNKYVGESEKNIKQVFCSYRILCHDSEVMPILLFNEADALINKRNEDAEGSADKMNNSMQNIILQEMENLDGILIATTNLTGCMDKAFERRFLYKVEFHKPTIEVKARIWKEMISELSDEDAHTLATNYDFSGGEIENIARKHIVDYILFGKQPSLHELESYCRNELLAKSNQRSRISGFSL